MVEWEERERPDAGVWWRMLLTEFLLQEPKYSVSVPQDHRNTVLFKVGMTGAGWEHSGKKD